MQITPVSNALGATVNDADLRALDDAEAAVLSVKDHHAHRRYLHRITIAGSELEAAT